jgi:hypothetical protein
MSLNSYSPMHTPAASLPARARRISLVSVPYTQLSTDDDGDLFLTELGAAFREHLDPKNWHAPAWFSARRTRLPGTSVIYKIPTKPIGGVTLDLVARFSRVGEPVPLETLTLHQNINAEFNSPFEEFALVMELRKASAGSGAPRIYTKKPLAIYVPGRRLEPWQTGRIESKMAAKLAKHPGVELDIHRQYILLYGWIDGITAARAADLLGLIGDARDQFLTEATLRAIHDLRQCGFRMLDVKPQHIIVRTRPDGSLLRKACGDLAYALVDYELLERLPDHRMHTVNSITTAG